VTTENDIEGGVLIDEDTDTKEPDEYRVILLNDDYTTMEFVVAVIMSVFHRDYWTRRASCSTSIAKGKASWARIPTILPPRRSIECTRLARENGFPLKCIMEKA